jgi:hypothetical protein
MSRRLPGSARLVLEDGVLCHLAVLTSSGPHLTPVVYVLDGGRLWITTSRSSVKAGAWRRDRGVAGLVRMGDLAVTFRGRVRTYDALDPLSWPSAAVAGPRLVSAATRFSLKNARFFAGYAVDARRVPFAWWPPGRLFAGIELLAGRVLDTVTGDVLEGWGEWPSGVQFARTYAPLGRTRPIDSRVPSAIRSAVGTSGAGVLALQARAQISVLPVAWRRLGSEGTFDAVIPEGFLRLARAGPRPQAALTISHAARWRAAEMAGMLLQGRAEIFSPTRVTSGAALLRRRVNAMGVEAKWEDPVLVRLRPARIVWWEGWTSGIVRAS